MRRPDIARRGPGGAGVRAGAEGAAGEAPRPNSLGELAAGASVEVPQRPLEVEALTCNLPAGATVHVPFVPRGLWRDTAVSCERILAAGMRPVPHLPARGVRSAGELDERLSELSAAGVDSLMLVAGDHARPAGPYPDTLALLDSGLLPRCGFRRLAVAAYPEGHSLVDRERLDRALGIKMEYAAATGTRMWVVTQFAFSPRPVLTWLARVEAMGCTLPVRVGIAGPARRRILLAYAVRCGIGSSAKWLSRRPGAVRLAGPWSPDVVAVPLARHRAETPGTALAGIHLFTFGALASTGDWLRAAGDGAVQPRASKANRV